MQEYGLVVAILAFIVVLESNSIDRNPTEEDQITALLMIFSILCLQFMPKRFMANFRYGFVEMSWGMKAILLTLLIVLIVQIESAEIQPFIYFQF